MYDLACTLIWGSVGVCLCVLGFFMFVHEMALPSQVHELYGTGHELTPSEESEPEPEPWWKGQNVQWVNKHDV